MRLLRCLRSAALLCVVAFMPAVSGAEPTLLEPDLKAVPARSGWRLFNRSASMLEEPGRNAVRLSAGGGLGLAILEGFSFVEGTIEFDTRGKGATEESFVGIAFHGMDESTFDAVYFKPLNFKTDDEVRRSRAVQYVSMPNYNWAQLRKRYPGMHERPAIPAPDPAAWFHVRVVVAAGQVHVYIDGSTESCMSIKRLSAQGRGWVALWMGNGSDGDFANLRITSP